MELSISLICQCNGKLYSLKVIGCKADYKTSATFKSHQKSGIHVLWELPNKVKDLQIKTTQLENENGHFKRLNVILLDRIGFLEKSNKLKQ